MFLGAIDEIRDFKGFFRCSSLFVAKLREYNALSGLKHIFMLQTQGVALSYHICPRWGTADFASF